MNEGYKNDSFKIRMDLLPPDALKEIAKVFTHGAQKYEEDNWAKGMNWSRLYGAAQRHLNAFWEGEDLDDEWNLNHLAHAGCNILMLLSLYLREGGTDNRIYKNKNLPTRREKNLAIPIKCNGEFSTDLNDGYHNNKIDRVGLSTPYLFPKSSKKDSIIHTRDSIQDNDKIKKKFEEFLLSAEPKEKKKSYPVRFQYNGDDYLVAEDMEDKKFKYTFFCINKPEKGPIIIRTDQVIPIDTDNIINTFKEYKPEDMSVKINKQHNKKTPLPSKISTNSTNDNIKVLELIDNNRPYKFIIHKNSKKDSEGNNLVTYQITSDDIPGSYLKYTTNDSEQCSEKFIDQLIRKRFF